MDSERVKGEGVESERVKGEGAEGGERGGGNHVEVYEGHNLILLVLQLAGRGKGDLLSNHRDHEGRQRQRATHARGVCGVCEGCVSVCESVPVPHIVCNWPHPVQLGDFVDRGQGENRNSPTSAGGQTFQKYPRADMWSEIPPR